jgi:hypothetical protein
LYASVLGEGARMRWLPSSAACISLAASSISSRKVRKFGRLQGIAHLQGDRVCEPHAFYIER